MARRTLPAGLLAPLALLGAALCAGLWEAGRELSGTDAERLRSAAALFDSLAAATRDLPPHEPLPTEAVVSLGYLERARLGLSSPYRLIDMALHDVRLTESARRRLAWGLLARLRDGGAYMVDPAALDGIRAAGPSASARAGARHLSAIEKVFTAASDPRGAELTVRLAYEIAAAEGIVASGGPATAAQAAALLRDRELAERDLRAILRAAYLRSTSPLEVVLDMRRRRDLLVERPSLAPLGADLEVEAMRAVPEFLAEIRSIAAEETGAAPALSRQSLLGARVARRLVDVAAAAPPQAPVVVTLRSHKSALAAGASPPARAAREAFIAEARNDEALAGAYALLAGRGGAGRAPAAALLATGAAMRAMAQEEPWMPDRRESTVAFLVEEFGIGDVTFDPRMPERWRSFYVQHLGGAMRDVRRVLPGFSFTGLRFTVETEALPDSALAMHDPASRTIRLRADASGGTLAHELAHDLDWQASRRVYAGGGGYGTDRAVREERAPLASSLRGLAAARLHGSQWTLAGSAPLTERPAEVFARSADWFLATALARQGISNGFLTVVQDVLLSGWVAGAPSVAGSVGSRALLMALQEMTYVPDMARASFLSRWEDAPRSDPYLVLHRTLTVPVRMQDVPERAWRPSLLASPAAIGYVCQAATLNALERARADLVDLAMEARAFGTVRRRAAQIARDDRPDWARSILSQAPWGEDDGIRAVREVRGQIRSNLQQEGALPFARTGEC